ncbi:MAG: hypothetical protein JWO22_1589 [Frankiales bacterium]|nr:hypothetical protein [Frankiales bacterium]
MSSPLGRYASDPDDDRVTVALLGAPLKVWQRAAEHHDELMREMALLALAADPPELPKRLTELVQLLGQQYGAAGSRPEDDREQALADGRDRIDLSYEVPRSAGPAAARMRALLDEAEEYCRTTLLTLQQSPVEAAFSAWYIDEFVRQTQGLPPTPWPGPWE